MSPSPWLLSCRAPSPRCHPTCVPRPSAGSAGRRERGPLPSPLSRPLMPHPSTPCPSLAGHRWSSRARTSRWRMRSPARAEGAGDGRGHRPPSLWGRVAPPVPGWWGTRASEDPCHPGSCFCTLFWLQLGGRDSPQTPFGGCQGCWYPPGGSRALIPPCASLSPAQHSSRGGLSFVFIRYLYK